MTTDPDLLIVASTAKWVYEDFASARYEAVNGTPSRWYPPVRYSFGFDIPLKSPKGLYDSSVAQRPAFWASTNYAARVKQAGASLPLVAPGPQWLSRAPERLTGRKVSTMLLADILADPTLMNLEQLAWVKLPEMKDERLPAQRTFIRDFVLEARHLGAPNATRVQFTFTNLCIVREDRYFIFNDKVITGSPYMQLGDVWDYDKHVGNEDWKFSQWGADFAQYAATTMKSHSPRAYTLDVAQVMDTDDDYHVVLEANPVWSSAIYGSDPELAMRAVLAGVDYSESPRKLWYPDAWLQAKAEKAVPLKFE